VIDVDKISLPVCAFGAGLAHVVALALVLPIAITLPAAGQSMTARLVAVDIEIVAPEPKTVMPDLIAALVAEPEAGADATPDPDAGIPTEAADDITGALPEPTSQDPASNAVAAVDAVTPPLPVRVIRDSDENAEAEVEPKLAPAPARPVQRAAPKRGPSIRTAPRSTARQEAAPYKGSWDALLGK
jgi:hypothetical protein